MKVRANNPRATLVTVAPTSPRIVAPTTASQTIFKRYAIQTESLLWVIPHNQHTTKFIATLRDINENQFYALIHNVDHNTFNVVLTTATKGFVDVVFDTSGAPDIVIP